VLPQPVTTLRPFELRVPGRPWEVEAAVRVPFLGARASGKAVRRVASVDDLDLLLGETRSAANQFSDGGPNLLVIAPPLDEPRPTLPERARLRAALRANDPSLWRRDFAAAAALGPPAPNPLSDGKFLRQWAERGWLPDRGRVSAIVYLEERYVETHPFPWEALFEWVWTRTRDHARAVEERLLAQLSDENRVHVGHRVVIVHNPHADHLVDPEPFGAFTQIRPSGARPSPLGRGPSSAAAEPGRGRRWRQRRTPRN
jgi:hypothetical protein